MNSRRASRKAEVVQKKVNSINEGQKLHEPSASLEKNFQILQALFADVDTLQFKTFENLHQKAHRFGIAFSNGLVNSAVVNDNILKPLMTLDLQSLGPITPDMLIGQLVQIGDARWSSDFSEIIESVCYGDTILFAEGIAKGMILSTKQFTTRATTEPENERSLLGPREGFTESLLDNLSLIRRKVRTNELKMRTLSLGKRTKTEVCVCYMNGIAAPDMIDQVFQRIGRIDIDAVLDSNYIMELIRDKRWALFRSIGYTERPDVVIGKLLEGRIAIFADGSPTVLTVPYLFIENFQSNEDYYLSFYYTTYSRILRIIGFILTIFVPGIYIAVVAFHQEMLPTPLLMNIAADQHSVPFPAVLEAFIMLVIFDILRETGIRMPSNIGQALSIVGALVIGQAAVAAKMVSSPMIIIVGITGITNLLVPKLNAPVVYLRFFILLGSSIFGFYGFVLATACMFIHIFNLTTLGVPQVVLDGSLQFQKIKDIAFRAPWWKMIKRPDRLTTNLVRNRPGDGNNG